MAKLKRQSPLGGFEHARHFKCLSFELFEEIDLGIIKVVARGLSKNDIRAFGDVLGVEVPTAPNEFVSGEDIEIACQAPNEWLLQTDDRNLRDLEKTLKDQFSDNTALICDLSDGRCAIRVDGEGAIPVLTSLLPIDLTAIPEKGAWCATTILSEIAVFVARPAKSSGFRIIVDQSYASYAWRMLEGADGGDNRS